MHWDSAGSLPLLDLLPLGPARSLFISCPMGCPQLAAMGGLHLGVAADVLLLSCTGPAWSLFLLKSASSRAAQLPRPEGSCLSLLLATVSSTRRCSVLSESGSSCSWLLSRCSCSRLPRPLRSGKLASRLWSSFEDLRTGQVILCVSFRGKANALKQCSGACLELCTLQRVCRH